MSKWQTNSLFIFSILLTIISVGVIVDAQSLFQKSPEIQSPSDWIKEEQIKVYNDRVILNIKNSSWARFTNTNSMDPFLDEESNAIEIIPVDPTEIQAGDIVSYKITEATIIHREIERGEDREGVYYILKGDNNSLKDPVKVRFNQITGVVVAVIY